MENTVHLLRVINQVFEIEKKSLQNSAILRPVERIKNTFSDMDFQIHNPIGEPYNETRTDCEASITGEGIQNLIIVDVIKPLVHHASKIVQKAVVIVESKRV